MPDQFDFRGSPRGANTLDLSKFIHSQEASEALATGTANKQAEIDAMLARARIGEEAHIKGIEINRASQEGIAAAHDANILKIHEKDTLTSEQIDAINTGNPGLNLPRVDGLPVSTAATLIGVVRAADRDASRERIAAASNERIANTQAATAARGQDIESRRITTANNMEIHRQEQERLAQQRLDDAAAEKRRAEAQGNLNSLIKGALNTAPNKQDLNTVFDPSQALIDNPAEALDLASQVGAAGGFPKGVPVAPIKPFPSPGIGNLWSETPAYKAEKATYDANVSQWKKSVAPPSTGGGLNKPKNVPSELAPSAPSPSPSSSLGPAGIQQVPSTMGGLGGMVETPTPRPTVIRVAPDGRRIEYDAITKQPLRVVQ